MDWGNWSKMRKASIIDTLYVVLPTMVVFQIIGFPLNFLYTYLSDNSLIEGQTKDILLFLGVLFILGITFFAGMLLDFYFFCWVPTKKFDGMTYGMKRYGIKMSKSDGTLPRPFELFTVRLLDIILIIFTFGLGAFMPLIDKQHRSIGQVITGVQYQYKYKST